MMGRMVELSDTVLRDVYAALADALTLVKALRRADPYDAVLAHVGAGLRQTI